MKPRKSKMPITFRAKVKYLREKMTRPEQILWEQLRNRKFHGYKFRRHHPIRAGFILDFYCEKIRLGIEVDGTIHQNTQVKGNDEYRSKILREMGIKVLRLTNALILDNLDHALSEILDACKLPSPSGRGVGGEGGENHSQLDTSKN